MAIIDRFRHHIRYARFFVFQRLLSPFSAWTRRRRLQTLRSRINIVAGTTVLDLGGTARTWRDNAFPPLDITVLNLPESLDTPEPTHHRLRMVAGDGCKVEIEDGRFDVVFSNSVIEHVGDQDKRRAFAAEVRRLGHSYWVQTPSIWFPLEAHTGMPLWWLYPSRLRRTFLKRWHKKLPAWTEMIEGTTVVSKSELRRLFPDAQILVERLLGIPKSYIAVRSAVPAMASPRTSPPDMMDPVGTPAG